MKTYYYRFLDLFYSYFNNTVLNIYLGMFGGFLVNVYTGTPKTTPYNQSIIFLAIDVLIAIILIVFNEKIAGNRPSKTLLVKWETLEKSFAEFVSPAKFIYPLLYFAFFLFLYAGLSSYVNVKYNGLQDTDDSNALSNDLLELKKQQGQLLKEIQSLKVDSRHVDTLKSVSPYKAKGK